MISLHCREFDDWGIEYHCIPFQSAIPSEDEIIRVVKVNSVCAVKPSLFTHSTRSIQRCWWA